MAKTYIETEVQGPGRRFWFRTIAARDQFAKRKRRAGYTVFREGRTVWASRAAKARTSAVNAVLHGIDPLAVQQ